MKTIIAEQLNVNESTLNAFNEFDGTNQIEGYICHQADHRYGALIITKVNGKDAFQIIYCTPKLQYPFKTTDTERVYHFPKYTEFLAYEKLDGTNICQYSYADANGKRYVGYKTRLTAVLKSSKFGDFKALWGEMLEKYHIIKNPPYPIITGRYTASYELFGYRNPHLIIYNKPLDTKLLFFVNQETLTVIPPTRIQPSKVWMEDKYIISNDIYAEAPNLKMCGNDNIVAAYETLRANDEKNNKKTDDGIIGTEGSVFYVKTDNQWIMYKEKPESVEHEHWATGSIPEDIIIPTIWNSLELTQDIEFDTVVKMLLEEFTEAQVNKSTERVKRCIINVQNSIIFRDKVLSEYDKIEDKKVGKAKIMQTLSAQFSKYEMRKVYNVLHQAGLV